MRNAIITELIFHLEMTRFVVGFGKLSSYPKGDHKFSEKFCIFIDY